MRYGVRLYGQGDPLFTKSAAIGIRGPILAFHPAGVPPVDNVYDYGFTDHPWLAADPTLGP